MDSFQLQTQSPVDQPSLFLHVFQNALQLDSGTAIRLQNPCQEHAISESRSALLDSNSRRSTVICARANVVSDKKDSFDGCRTSSKDRSHFDMSFHNGVDETPMASTFPSSTDNDCGRSQSIVQDNALIGNNRNVLLTSAAATDSSSCAFPAPSVDDEDTVHHRSICNEQATNSAITTDSYLCVPVDTCDKDGSHMSEPERVSNSGTKVPTISPLYIRKEEQRHAATMYGSHNYYSAPISRPDERKRVGMPFTEEQSVPVELNNVGMPYTEEQLVSQGNSPAETNGPLCRSEIEICFDSKQQHMPNTKVSEWSQSLWQLEADSTDHACTCPHSMYTNDIWLSQKEGKVHSISVTDSNCHSSLNPLSVDSSRVLELDNTLNSGGGTFMNCDYALSTLRSDQLNHGDVPFTKEEQVSEGALQRDLNDPLFQSETVSVSHGQKWRTRLKEVSYSWQSPLRPKAEVIPEHSPPSPFPVSEYNDVISAVLQIAKCLSKNQTLQEHLQVFSGQIDHLCGNAILYNLQKERLSLSALSFFDWMRNQTPCLLNSRALCTMFTILGDAHMVDRAFLLYDNLKHQKELLCVQVFNALLSSLSKHNRYDQALAVFQEMLAIKIQPDNVTCSILLNLAHKSGSKSENLWHIFVDLEKRKVFVGHEVFGVLIKAFCQQGLRDEALQLLSMMEGRGLIPNVVIYNTLIRAFAKSGLLDAAEGLVSEMTEKGICMTTITYNILIDAYANFQDFEAAEAVLQGMLEKGPRPDVHSFTSLVAAYGRNFLSEKAASVFLRMRKNGVSPNVVAYTALIHAYAEDGWHMKAELAFENMVREGFQPTVETYTSLLHAFRQVGDLEKVKSIWKRMRLELNLGTRETFNVLMDACAKQGDYAEARNVIHEFKKSGYKPDTKTYNMLIHAYARGGQHSKAAEILEEMKKAGFHPDCFTYTTLIYSFLRVRDFSQAFEYHDKMCAENKLPDKFTYKKIRALLDEKYAAKAERIMKAAVGIQKQKYDTNKGKRTKSFRKQPRQHAKASVSKAQGAVSFGYWRKA